MSEDSAISVENVSKAYRIWASSASRLTSPSLEVLAGIFPQQSSPAKQLREYAASSYRDFYALRDISFKVKRGESMGIIGRNGSGKSTLLQIIAGTLQPSAGQAKVQGRVAALLELGSGFNPEFTGRENVHLNGAVLGLTRREIGERFDAITGFAEIGDFIDQPVKTYSSGMLVRLAFAVAISTEPEILIVDEALSVGDIFFQQRCFSRIRELLAQGTTLFFVSHDTAAIQNLCARALLLESGQIRYVGAPEECVSRYHARHGSTSVPAAADKPAESILPDFFLKQTPEYLQHNLVPRARARHGARQLEIISACFRTPSGHFTHQAGLMQPFRIEVLVRAHAPIAQPSCGLHFFDRMNNLVYAAGNLQLGIHFKPLEAGAAALLIYTITMSVQPGPYTFNIAVGEPGPSDANSGRFYDVCEGLGPIDIIAPNAGVWPFYGIANLPMQMEVIYE